MAWAKLQENYHRWGALRAMQISTRNLLGRLGLELVFVYNRPLVGDSSDPLEEKGIAYRALSKADLELASSDPELGISRDYLAKVLPWGIFAVAHMTATNSYPMHGAVVWKQNMLQG